MCSSSPGLTGFLSIDCQIDDTGRFASDLPEPDNYESSIRKALKGLVTEEYKKRRQNAAIDDRLRDDDGYIRLEMKPTPEEVNKMFWEHPEQHGMYRVGNELRFIPGTDQYDKNGYIVLVHKDEMIDPKDKMTRDKDGYVIFEESRPLKRWDSNGNKVDFPPDFEKQKALRRMRYKEKVKNGEAL